MHSHAVVISFVTMMIMTSSNLSHESHVHVIQWLMNTVVLRTWVSCWLP